MSILAKTTIRVAGRFASARFHKATLDTRASQLACLRSILDSNADTEYGRRYGFAKIRTFEDYARQVPIIDYEKIRPLVDRMADGEQNVLTAEAPVMFARTSGTTGNPKLIPVTPSCQGRSHGDQIRTWLYHAQRDHPGILGGKIASLVSPAVEGHTSAGIPYGSTSGMMYRDQPWLLRNVYAFPYELFTLHDYETRYYLANRLALCQPISFLCTANPSTILKLAESADEHAEELIRDVHDGTMTTWGIVHEELRAKLRLRSDPRRARELARMRQRRDGHLLPADYWPRLALIGCWTGGTVGNYVDQFARYFDPDGNRPVALRDWGYLASEARGSVPLADNSSGGVLTVNANVFEFVPAEDVDAAPDDPSSWRVVDATGVEKGGLYHVILTTTGGLYRYDINDIVRIEGFSNGAPVVSFVRKGRGMTNMTGEKLSEDQVITAFTRAAKEVGVELLHLRAEAAADESRYLFRVEIGESISRAKQHELLERIDAQLREINIEYDGKRESQRLRDPCLFVMKPGWHDRIVTASASSQDRVFQTKVPPLVNHEDVDEAEEKKQTQSQVEM